MDKRWKAVKRADSYWYVEKPDGTAVLSAIGTPAHEREQVVRLAAAAPYLARFQAAANDALSLLCEDHVEDATEKALEALNLIHKEADEIEALDKLRLVV